MYFMFGPSVRSMDLNMPSADFCRSIPPPLGDSSTRQIDRSPRVMRIHLPAYARRIYDHALPYRYRTLKTFDLSSGMAASYAISVRRASVLPAASFRFHLAMDTLAVRLTVPPVGSVEDFHLQVNAPCRAHKKKGANLIGWLPRIFWRGRRDLNPRPPA